MSLAPYSAHIHTKPSKAMQTASMAAVVPIPGRSLGLWLEDSVHSATHGYGWAWHADGGCAKPMQKSHRKPGHGREWARRIIGSEEQNTTGTPSPLQSIHAPVSDQGG